MTQPIDADIRRQALDTSASFAVSAPAGSGKTGLLTQRVLALLAQCEQPENLLAITFTKKAAAEMQSRILAALHNAQTQTEAPKDDFSRTTWMLARAVILRNQEKQWQLLSLPNRLQITTIDSFCRQLSQRTPLINTLGNTPDVLDNAGIKQAYQLAARETLKLLEQNHPLKEDLIRLSKHFNNQMMTIESLFSHLLSRRDQWLGPLYRSQDQRVLLESTLQQVITEHLQTTQQALLPLSGELLTLADYAATTLSNDNKLSDITHCKGITSLPANNYQALSEWSGLAELTLTKQGSIRSTVDKRSGFPAADKTMDAEQKKYVKAQKQRMLHLLDALKTRPNIASLLHNIRSLPSPGYTDEQWQLLNSLTPVLTLLVAQLKLIFQQLGKTDFIEITLAALNTLGTEDQPTDIALAMDYRIQHILIDEFQDTSTPQLHLLKQLTAGWQVDDGRTLFIVGDAMQSCYGFRDANVGIFLDIRKNGLADISLMPLDLSVNFRSQAPLVHWFNRIFTDVLPEQDSINQGAVKYQQAIAFNETGSQHEAVSTFIFARDEAPKQRTEETEKIVGIIRHHQQTTPNNSIAVLVRKRSQVGEITQALNSAGILYRATDIDPLDTNMVIMDLLSLTRALLYPNDRIAWLSLLRSPWCGLDMFDLYAIANWGKEGQKNLHHLLSAINNENAIATLSVNGQAIITRFKEAIASIMRQQARCNLRQWIESAWLQLGGSASLMHRDEMTVIKQFFTVLEKYQSAGKLQDWEIFIDAVKQLYADSSSHMASSDDKAIVDIMTIHKSKGLEFDTVIIPGLDHGSAADKPQLLAWLEWLDHSQNNQLVISPVNATGSDADAIHTYIRQQQQQRQQLEADRLFYVGCTRAIKRLHLLAYAKVKDKDGTIELERSTTKNTLTTIWPYIKNNIHLMNTESAIPNHWLKEQNPQQHPNVIVRQNLQWQRPQYPENNLLQAYRLNHYSETLNVDNRANPSDLQQRNARYLGTILHSALQHITESGYQQWDEQRLIKQSTIWEKQLRQLGGSPELIKPLTEKIVVAVSNMLNSNIGCWLLDHQHPKSACELSLWTGKQHELQEWIIDRTFIDKQTHERWIIDYKSSEPVSGESVNDFVAGEVKKYHKQLVCYQQLFGDEKNIHLALYFPLVNHFHEFDDI